MFFGKGENDTVASGRQAPNKQVPRQSHGEARANEAREASAPLSHDVTTPDSPNTEGSVTSPLGVTFPRCLDQEQEEEEKEEEEEEEEELTDLTPWTRKRRGGRGGIGKEEE
ncbi:hypothetical protein E2C01_073559 [Portunus trituberculatus]|uniref:Uncharacterized protein n=1 Tax=Portunus trituberculatus TaxID=210409 RepID=A0A5B7IC03_PORTR|nr:hypothetical protein [Portunus trituberculatus]